MTLPADICRCHDAGCPEREQCRRWLERHSPSAAVHYASLHRLAFPTPERCEFRIPVEES